MNKSNTQSLSPVLLHYIYRASLPHHICSQPGLRTDGPPLCFAIPCSGFGQHGLLSVFRELLLLPFKIEQYEARLITFMQGPEVISHILVSFRVLLEFELHYPLPE